ncbi:MAG: [FeFe] hydrogenase H-cluster maturation GTPase HydF [Candidatus Omnitrophica bacterium]|nr:[FeFe] hydrogenase H-cluster maturation GTPase HydF [Candidatus Omnitrophota bacterium]MDD5546145.1 [FeFe] hydrogenase H-cluster maturation GTPase HydF [Candidatus Omnitrophota bacterium]
MIKTPKSLRLQIGLFGRTNVGKSSFLNFVAGQDVAITSPVAGTTTDVVEKSMELLPVGPVVFLDTAGLDDISTLSDLRLKKTAKIFDRADIITLITEAGAWTGYEEKTVEEARKREIPLIIVINKADLKKPSDDFLAKMSAVTTRVMACSSLGYNETILDAGNTRDASVEKYKRFLLEICPDDFLKPPLLTGDLVPKGGIAVLIMPIDKEAPKGRLILPQVQTIRDVLDNDGISVVVKETEYLASLKTLSKRPDIVVCDSQVVLRMVKETPPDVKCTTFSIIFIRYKGDLVEMARGAAAIERLKPGDKVLIAEACSHHAIEDDIGRVKIPRWLNKFAGGEILFKVCSGRDYPGNLKEYKLIIHCGSCMITRREMLTRIEKAKEAGVPITNYGLAISLSQGVLERVLSPFPASLEAFINERERSVKGASR